MASIRLAYDFFRRQETKAFGYIRKHPRSSWLIALDAVLSASLVFGIFTYTSNAAQASNMKALRNVGAVAMTSSEFVSHVIAEGKAIYWMGDLAGFDISLVTGGDDVSYVSYVKRGHDLSNWNFQKITLVTYRGGMRTEGPRHFGTWADPASLVTAGGLVVAFDKGSMKEELVNIGGTSNVVSIYYPEAQTTTKFMENAVALRLVA